VAEAEAADTQRIEIEVETVERKSTRKTTGMG
jgi:hypothetical protein